MYIIDWQDNKTIFRTQYKQKETWAKYILLTGNMERLYSEYNNNKKNVHFYYLLYKI